MTNENSLNQHPDTELPSALEILVTELNHSGKSQYVGALYPVPTRLKAPLFGLVEALAEQAGVSRNKLINQIIEVGIDTTLKSLSKDLVHQLQLRSGQIIMDSIQNPKKTTRIESGTL